MDPDDKRVQLLVLLVKLNVLGIRKVTYSFGTLLSSPLKPDPPCSIPCAIVNLSKQFLPKTKYKDEDKRVAFDKLNILLEKLGMRSARFIFGANSLSAADLTNALNRIQTDFGKPDTVYMDPWTLSNLKKNLK